VVWDHHVTTRVLVEPSGVWAMTFYNIIFGILFFAASKEVLRCVYSQEWIELVMALTIGVFIINDTVFVSEMIEQRGHPYKIKLKLIDVLCFMLLYAAIVMLYPEAFDVKVSSPWSVQSRDLIFWILLMLYWMCIIWWNYESGFVKLLGKRRVFTGLLLIPIALAFVVSGFIGREAYVACIYAIPGISMICYIAFVKLDVLDQTEGPSTVGNMDVEDFLKRARQGWR
jgi:hypothetical protein